MGYNMDDHVRVITKSSFIKPWQFLVTQRGICFSKKIVNFHEVSYRLMEPMHAIVQEVPYISSHYLVKYFTSNLWSSRAFLVYPRFRMRVITHQLGFGGVPICIPELRCCYKKAFTTLFLY
ncbi:hypothetical protein Hanom_Chr03g00199381 [Helianthus anomalus]